MQLRAELAERLAELEAATESALASYARLAAAAGGEADEDAGLCAIAGPALALGDGSSSFGALSLPLPIARASEHELAVDSAVASAGGSPRRHCRARASALSLPGKGSGSEVLPALDLASVQQQAQRLRADIAFARRIAGALGGGQPLLPGPSAHAGLPGPGCRVPSPGAP